MAFEDVIDAKSNFKNILCIGKEYIASDADLVVQTVCTPSILSEKAFLMEKERIVEYHKNGIAGEIENNQQKKYGGMVYLWLSNPFGIIDQYLSDHNYKFSSFWENYVLSHTVYEMSINEMKVLSF